MRRLPLALALCPLLLSGCPRPQPGTVVGAGPDTSFAANSTTRLVVATPAGLTEVGPGGQSPRLLAGPGYHLRAVAPGWSVWALSNSDTDLFLGPPGGTPQRIVELDRRLGGGAFSPDGSIFVAYRHADFSRPQSQWVDEDGLVLISLPDLTVTEVPSTSNRMITGIRWDDADASGPVLHFFSGPSEQVSGLLPGTGVPRRSPWTPPPAPPSTEPLGEFDQNLGLCGGLRLASKGWGADEGLELVEADGSRRTLVEVRGRERGFHDYIETVRGAQFVEDCGLVAFHFQQDLWVADVASGATGPLMRGELVWVRSAGVREGEEGGG